MIKNKILIIGIVLIAFFLRIWNISNLPSSLSMDEVTFGYASYSVMNTLSDEHGRILPLSFKGMGDYNPPVDVYLKIPFIKLFGLNELSVRLPNLLLGTLTVLVLYMVLRKMNFAITSSLLTAFWLAVSGWHIFLSRAGYEAITALFFLMMGLYFFISWLKQEKYLHFVLFVISFCLSAWAYHSERMYIPLLFIGLLISFKDYFVKNILKKNKTAISLLILSIFIIPFLYEAFVKKGIFPRSNDLWFAKDITNGNIYTYLRSWFGQYLKYFDLRFVFWKAVGITPNGYPDLGLLNIFDAIIIFLGLSNLLNTKNNVIKRLAPLLLFLGPIPAAFARGNASSIRILLWIPLFGILIALGFEKLFEKSKKWMLIILTWIAGSIFVLIYFTFTYINNFDKYYADLWHFGYKEAAIYICQNYQKYDKVILTDKYGIEIPKIKTIPHYYILFFCKYDPSAYLKNPLLFNLEIRQPQWRIDSKNKNYLLVGSNWDFPENFDTGKIMKKIVFNNGKDALWFVETNK